MRLAFALIVIALAVALGIGHLERTRPQDLPWTPLAMADPPGMFTRTKLARLAADPAACAAMLGQAGLSYTPVEDRPPVDGCGWIGAVTLGAPVLGGRALTLSCPVAVGVAMWRAKVVEPAARRHMGEGLRRLEHYGGYSCRRIGGTDRGDFSEHATANAIDVAGFALEGGGRVTLLGGWNGPPAQAAFLREASRGACEIFGTTLGPEYNAAHADHFHLDMKPWGMGYGVCR